MSETAVFLSNINFRSLVTKFLVRNLCQLTLQIHQVEVVFVWIWHLRNLCFSSLLHFFPLCLQCGHLICSSGSFMGIWRMILRMVEQKYRTIIHLWKFNGAVVTTLIFFLPVILYIKMNNNNKYILNENNLTWWKKNK